MSFLRWSKRAPLQTENPTLGIYGQLYERHIRSLCESGQSLPEALQTSVGGDFEAYGKIERDLLLGLGLTGEAFVVDIGCGAGRLAQFLKPVLGRRGRYLGLDVHPALLEEARTRLGGTEAPPNFDLELISTPCLPCEDGSAEFICAFSVATHIDLEETYSYMEEMNRVLKIGGKGIISYLSAEIPDHWRIFLDEKLTPAEVRSQKVRNHVMPPGALSYLANRAGLRVDRDVPADEACIVLSEAFTLNGKYHAPGDSINLGQSWLLLSPGKTL